MTVFRLDSGTESIVSLLPHNTYCTLSETKAPHDDVTTHS